MAVVKGHGVRSPITTKLVTGASYLVVKGDLGKHLIFDNATLITVTFNTGMGDGFWFTGVQKGVGQVDFSVGTATIDNIDSFTKTEAEGAPIGIFPTDVTDTYTLTGRLVP